MAINFIPVIEVTVSSAGASSLNFGIISHTIYPEFNEWLPPSTNRERWNRLYLDNNDGRFNTQPASDENMHFNYNRTSFFFLTKENPTQPDNNSIFLFAGTKIPNSGAHFAYLNENGQITTRIVAASSTMTLVCYAPSPSTPNITLRNGGNLKRIQANELMLFPENLPYTITPEGNMDITATGKDDKAVTLQNTQNMQKTRIGSTDYNTFPQTHVISEDTTIQLYGKPDPVITVNYDNTTVPEVTNT